MQHKPKVSVIIPNYNYAQYLEKRFQSILNQTYRGYEIIFLDDASTDDSVSLVRDQFNTQVTCLEINPINSGNPFIQWNRGVRMCQGEYIWIAEADDFCAPDFLERTVSVMNDNPSIGLAYCNTTPVDTMGKIIDSGFYQRYVSDLDRSRWLRDFTADGPGEVRHYLARKNTITNVSGVLFRREAYIRGGYAPENLRMCGDWLTYCRVLHGSDLAYISASLNFHRQHPAKHTQNSVLDLTYFREFLQVQDYMAGAFHLSNREKQAAFHRFLGEWDRLTISNYGRIGFGSTFALARMAAQFYKGPLNSMIISAHLLFTLFKSLLGKLLKK